MAGLAPFIEIVTEEFLFPLFFEHAATGTWWRIPVWLTEERGNAIVAGLSSMDIDADPWLVGDMVEWSEAAGGWVDVVDMAEIASLVEEVVTVGGEALGWAPEEIAESVAAVAGSVSDVVSEIVETVSEVGAPVLEAFEEGAEVVTEAGARLVGVVEEAVELVVEVVKDVVEPVVEVAEEVVEEVVEVGSDVVETVGEVTQVTHTGGIFRTVGGWIKNTTKSAWDKTKDFFTSWFHRRRDQGEEPDELCVLFRFDPRTIPKDLQHLNVTMTEHGALVESTSWSINATIFSDPTVCIREQLQRMQPDQC